jgi:hypothetical protein
MKNKIWTITRTAGFFLIGLMNTAFIRPENSGSWKNYAGYLFVFLAIADSFYLVKNFIRKKKAS